MPVRLGTGPSLAFPTSPGVTTITAPRPGTTGCDSGRSAAIETGLPYGSNRPPSSPEKGSPSKASPKPPSGPPALLAEQGAIDREEVKALCARHDVSAWMIGKVLDRFDRTANGEKCISYDDFVQQVAPLVWQRSQNGKFDQQFHTAYDYGPRFCALTSNFHEHPSHRGATRGKPPPACPHQDTDAFIFKGVGDLEWITDAMGHPPKGGVWPSARETWKEAEHSVKCITAKANGASPREASCPTAARYNLTMSSPCKSVQAVRTMWEGHRARSTPRNHPDREKLREVPFIEKGSAWFDEMGSRPEAVKVQWQGHSSKRPAMYIYETDNQHEFFTRHSARAIPNFKTHMARDKLLGGSQKRRARIVESAPAKAATVAA